MVGYEPVRRHLMKPVTVCIAKMAQRRRVPAEANRFDRNTAEVGPRDIISRVTRRWAQVSDAKRAPGATNMQNRKRIRNRRLQMARSRKVADLQEVLVKKQLAEAGHLWKRSGLPASGETANIAGEYPTVAVRYAKQGRRPVDLSRVYGAIRGENRGRDEWKAKCCGNGLDHRMAAQNT